MSIPAAPLYPTRDHAVTTTCPSCADVATHTVPILLDWRDRAKLTALWHVFPDITCAACGKPVSNGAPIVILRPGDPVEVLVSGRGTSKAHLDLITELIEEHATNPEGRTRGPVAVIPAPLLPAVAACYLGFALQNMAEPDEDWIEGPVHAWLAGLRAGGDWPDLGSALAAYLTGSDSIEDVGPTPSNPAADQCLREEQWQPAIRLLARRIRQAQPSRPQAEAVGARMRELSRLALADTGIEPGNPAVATALDLLAAVNTAQSRPNRTRDDVRAGVATGRDLLDHLAASGLASTPLALIRPANGAGCRRRRSAHPTPCRSLRRGRGGLRWWRRGRAFA